MAEISKREKQLEWACRLLMTADVIVILSGYLSWFQTKYQLVTPLIPRSTIYEIFNDAGDIHFKVSIIAALIFLSGLWFYFFKKKILAIVLFSATIVLFPMKNFFFKIQVLPKPTSIHLMHGCPPLSSPLPFPSRTTLLLPPFFHSAPAV